MCNNLGKLHTRLEEDVLFKSGDYGFSVYNGKHNRDAFARARETLIAFVRSKSSSSQANSQHLCA